ncbi:serine hydrolase domain-containing protein [Microbacterium sp. M1A1_1b]
MTEVSTTTIEQVDALFRERVERGVAPSSVWGVFDQDGLIATGGHGDRGDGTAPDADTVYRIASCTKSITAATLLSLQADGRVSLDAPITDFVPAFGDVGLPTADSPVPTLRMLLTMSAGFPTDDPWGDRQESITDAELDAVLRDGLLFDSVPGTGFAYSNLGYALLGRAIQVVAGRPFADVASQVVLRPLGLDDTVFRAADARGYVVTGVRPHQDTWEPLPLSGPGAFSPIGGLFSTVRDLSRWARHLSSAFASVRDRTGRADSGPVSPADRRHMQQAMRVIPAPAIPSARRPVGYGFGLFVEQDDTVGPIVSHSGGYPGFSAHMRWSVRTGLGVVAFENATQAKVSVATETAHDVLLGLGRPAAHPAPARPVAAGPVTVLPETRAAQSAVSRLLIAWHDAPEQTDPDDSAAARCCTPNVPMDVPWDRRRAAAARAVATIGADLHAAPVAEASSAPTHLRWWLPGSSGRLRVEIRLAPLAAGLVQTLLVTAEPTERDA